VIAFGKKHSASCYDIEEGAELIRDSNLYLPRHNTIFNGVYTQVHSVYSDNEKEELLVT
jgi:hypothetical protein